MSSVSSASTARIHPYVQQAIDTRLRTENNWNPCGVPRFSQGIANRWLASKIDHAPYLSSAEKCRAWLETNTITGNIHNNQNQF
ncbi:hypothetical protein B9Z55_024399 [Caenorhabditis nigoni]|uniref:Uncharacterized protein n=1 Tax=Caenorhabditis nigoni TaxID=1611254 RepID=A0A2G5SU40_9PELO|nr:hypothetical protein B9Z55_024399 [Caenorhabditis nigoni]